ncbi:MAG: 3'-5' exonuclease [Coriobacteriia bacterium]|nr:3'-5' exonuclease [Coriobacteriia bacterium]
MTKYVSLDVETTGLNLPALVYKGKRREQASNLDEPKVDEVIQLAIIDHTEEVLFYDSFKPSKRASWKAAEAINSISPESVAHKQSFSRRLEEIQSIVNRADILIAFNADFDLQFLHAEGVCLRQKPYICAMEMFAQASSARKRKGGRAEFKSLAACASFFGLSAEGAHNALVDARTTLSCYKKMTHDERFSAQQKIWNCHTLEAPQMQGRHKTFSCHRITPDNSGKGSWCVHNKGFK